MFGYMGGKRNVATVAQMDLDCGRKDTGES